MKPPFAVALLALAAALVAAPGLAAVGDWGQGSQARIRLLAAGVDADGILTGGIEIALPAGWKTYWRSPGDAGVPPKFDFAGSTNFADAAVAFPVPTRQDDGFAVTNIYHDRVLLPFSARVADPSAPVEIAMHAQIGACQEVCIPEDITASLMVAPGAQDADVAAALAAVRKNLPGPPVPGAFAFTAAARDGGTDRDPVFRFVGIVPQPDKAIVFVEGPDDWAPYTPDYVGETGGAAAWTVKFSRLGAKTPIAGASFRLTVVSGAQAIDQTVALP